MTKRTKSKSKKPPAQPKSNGVPAFYATQRELAFLFSLSISQIRKDLDNGAPKRTGHGYDVKEWIGWRIGRRGSKGSSALERAETRIKEGRAVLVEMQVGQLQGTLIDSTNARGMRNRLVSIFASILDRAPAELAPLVGGKTPRAAKVLIKSYFDQARDDAVDREKAKR